MEEGSGESEKDKWNPDDESSIWRDEGTRDRWVGRMGKGREKGVENRKA